MYKDRLLSLNTPCFIIYEEKIKRNLAIIDDVRRKAGVEIVMAFKANAVWKTFSLLRKYHFGFAASSLNELTLGYEELNVRGHTYCLAYKNVDFVKFLKMSSHLTFNSLDQWNIHKAKLEEWNNGNRELRVSPGLRVNPHCNLVSTDIYNPGKRGSRFGVSAENLMTLPEGIEGLHFHQLCESTSYDLEKVLEVFEKEFGHLLPHLKWINMGGGHLMTREGYNVAHLISLLTDFRQRHPNLNVILEPGSAFMWKTGDLLTTIMDIVEDSGITTAIIDGSFTCHMPDTLEMPYKPEIAEALSDNDGIEGIEYNIGGNSCLSGDYKGSWRFKKQLKRGDKLTFKDMNHYTTVKTTMFNGLEHPSLVLIKENGESVMLREYGYDDYKNRMS